MVRVASDIDVSGANINERPEFSEGSCKCKQSNDNISAQAELPY